MRRRTRPQVQHPAMLVALLFGAAPLHPQSVLVWQPAATTNTRSFDTCFGGVPAGSTLDVRTFSSLTQSQFDAYDIIWVDGGFCNFQEGTYAEVFTAAGTWGPVVDGRVVITTTDLDFHASSGNDACVIIQDTFAWLAASPGTAMYLSTGCDLAADTNAPNLTSLATIFGSFGVSSGSWEAVLNSPTPGHPTMAGPFAGPTNPTAYATFCHGAMTDFPAPFASVATCVDPFAVGAAFVVRDESPCFTGFCDPLTTCSYNLGGADPSCGPCPTGYSGSGETGCFDTDGCAGDPCYAGVTCTDVPAPGTGFTCGECPLGTTGDGITCTDIDGCAGDPCFPGVTCTDVPAPGTGFTCGECPPGTTGDGITCTDIDGCAGDPCPVGSICEDVPAPGSGALCLVPIFSDSFQTGDTSAWSSTVPTPDP